MKVNRTNKLSLPATANGIVAIWLSLVSLGLTTCAGGANSSPAMVTGSWSPPLRKG